MSFLQPGDPSALVTRVREGFAARHGRPAAVVARAPGRVNLIGEHTDHNRGRCLPLALPHATYAAAARSDAGSSDDLVRMTSVQEGTVTLTLRDLVPGRLRGWAAYAGGVLWALREAGFEVPGLDLYVDSTVPVGSGLSSSAALECAVAVAVCGLLDEPLTPDLRRLLVDVCLRAEREVAGAPTGGMDQCASLFSREGQALLLDFDTDDPAASAQPVPLGLDRAGLDLLVVDTRVAHALVDGGYASRRAECEAAARALAVPSLRHAERASVDALPEPLRRRARHVLTEDARVEEAVAALEAGEWRRLGVLLARSHASLRDDFEVSCVELDVAVEAATASGALGARMIGGGFGGSAVALVPGAQVATVVAAVDAAFAERGWTAPAHLRAGTGASGAGPLS